MRLRWVTQWLGGWGLARRVGDEVAGPKPSPSWTGLFPCYSLQLPVMDYDNPPTAWPIMDYDHPLLQPAPAHNPAPACPCLQLPIMDYDYHLLQPAPAHNPAPACPSLQLPIMDYDYSPQRVELRSKGVSPGCALHLRSLKLTTDMRGNAEFYLGTTLRGDKTVGAKVKVRCGGSRQAVGGFCVVLWVCKPGWWWWW